jgi:hypothetical protein
MKRSSQLAIGGGLAVLLLIVWCNASVGSGMAALLLMLIGLVATVAGVTYFLTNRTFTSSSVSSTYPLTEQLQTAFNSNNTRTILVIVRSLPSWPIRELIITVVQQLFTLKNSIQRARNEGVPESYLQRLSENIDLAANGIWQMVSKLDAVARQQVTYETIAAKLENEALQLQGLLQSLRQTHEGLALITLTDAHHENLQRAETDLYALAQAIRRIERVLPGA